MLAKIILIMVIIVIVVLSIILIVLLHETKEEKKECAIKFSVNGGVELIQNKKTMNELIPDFIAIEDEMHKTVCFSNGAAGKSQLFGQGQNGINMNANTGMNSSMNMNPSMNMSGNFGANSYSGMGVSNNANMNNSINQTNGNMFASQSSQYQNNMAQSMMSQGMLQNSYQQSFGNVSQPMMQPMKIVLTDIERRICFEKEISQNVIIGRVNQQGIDNFIEINYDASISRNHCQIERYGNRFYVCDLGAVNPVMVDNQVVQGRVEIFPGNTITLGQVQFNFTVI